MKTSHLITFIVFCSCFLVSCSSYSISDYIDATSECYEKGEYKDGIDYMTYAIEYIANDEEMKYCYLMRGCGYYLCFENEVGFDTENYKKAMSDLNHALDLFDCDDMDDVSYIEDINYYLGMLQYHNNNSEYVSYLKKGGKDGEEKLKSIGSRLPADSQLKKYFSQGSGFLIDSTGYIATNYHVIKDAIEDTDRIDCLIHEGDNLICYNATPIVYDKENDLAIIMIVDRKYRPVHIPYSIDYSKVKTGSSIFTMGYPDVWDLGSEIKVTKGIISSLSGYEGDRRQYQIDANIYGGNSGGPLFSETGGLIGVNSASFTDNDNINYSIKIAVMDDLVQQLNGKISLPRINELDSLTLSQKVEKIKPCVYLIGLYEN